MLSFFKLANRSDKMSRQSEAGKTAENNCGDAHTFGGFSSRWNYEDCRKKTSGVHPAAVLLVTFVCLFSGFSAALGTVLLFDFVKLNPQLYFPSEMSSASEQKPPEQLLVSDSAKVTDELYTGLYLDTVTEELSGRYRVPAGVMVKSADPSKNKSLADFLAGNIIVSINSNEITDIESLTKVYAPIPDGESVSMRVFRRNSYIDISFVKGVR